MKKQGQSTSERMVSIYSLADPDTNELKYVGKSVNPKKRLKYYLWCNDSRPVQQWVKTITDKGKEPQLIILDQVPESEWEFWEMYWIEQVKAWGFNLENIATGGLGVTGMKHTEERREKISHASKAMWSENGRREKHSTHVAGLKNANADQRVHEFYHKDHGPVSCTQFELRDKFSLCASKVSAIISGKRFEHKGWRMAENISAHSGLTDNRVFKWEKDGVVIECRKIDLLSLFPELDQSSLCRVISGKYNSHKGWVIKP